MLDDARWGDDPRDRDDDDSRDRDERSDFAFGRGSDSARTPDEALDRDGRDRDDDRRGLDRDREQRDRAGVVDPRDPFMRHVDLPRDREREIVRHRDREYKLRGSESRTLSTVGAFRVVSARDLRDHDGRRADPRSGDLRHLREQDLVRAERLPGHRDQVVVLTERGRDLLNARRVDRGREHRQEFYAGLVKHREVEHDAQVYRAYLREARKLAERGARVGRVVLDYELKRDYQRWLHERDRERERTDGRPDREPREIEEWAREHDLPSYDEQVHFLDVRIEFRDADGRWDHVDVEVTTMHYRGAHGASAARSGFSCYRGSSGRVGGRGGGGRGSGHRGGLAEELWE